MSRFDAVLFAMEVNRRARAVAYDNSVAKGLNLFPKPRPVDSPRRKPTLSVYNRAEALQSTFQGYFVQ